MSRKLGGDVPDLVKLYARKLWADFSYPVLACNSKRWSVTPERSPDSRRNPNRFAENQPQIISRGVL